MESMDDLFSLSAALQQCILNAPLPPQLEQAIEAAVAGMVERCGSELRLALRSSAVGEDALGVTFAGQYRSELNVLPEEACEVWKEIVASKYAVTAMSYRFQRGIPDEAAPMSVGVLSMVQALAGGVAYSRDPVASRQGRGQVTLNAVPGLPQAVVDGPSHPTCSPSAVRIRRNCSKSTSRTRPFAWIVLLRHYRASSVPIWKARQLSVPV